MGNSNSYEDTDQVGYRVLGVQPHSPASSAGLVSYFDFIVAANGIPLRTSDSTFVELIKTFEGKNLAITVYNTKSRTLRETNITPSRNWPGEGFLGVIIRFDSFHDAEENMCRVLDVEINSPAELAGLQPYTDYLLGTTEVVFKNTNVLFEILQANLEKPIEFYVYNSETDEVRLAILMPSTEWGGEGILGASIGQGYLHGLPAKCCETIGRSYESTIRGSQSPFGYNNSAYISAHTSPTQPITATIATQDIHVITPSSAVSNDINHQIKDFNNNVNNNNNNNSNDSSSNNNYSSTTAVPQNHQATVVITDGGIMLDNVKKYDICQENVSYTHVDSSISIQSDSTHHTQNTQNTQNTVVTQQIISPSSLSYEVITDKNNLNISQTTLSSSNIIENNNNNTLLLPLPSSNPITPENSSIKNSDHQHQGSQTISISNMTSLPINTLPPNASKDNTSSNSHQIIGTGSGSSVSLSSRIFSFFDGNPPDDVQ